MAIKEGRGVTIDIDSETDVPERLAQAIIARYEHLRERDPGNGEGG